MAWGVACIGACMERLNTGIELKVPWAKNEFKLHAWVALWAADYPAAAMWSEDSRHPRLLMCFAVSVLFIRRRCFGSNHSLSWRGQCLRPAGLFAACLHTKLMRRRIRRRPRAVLGMSSCSAPASACSLPHAAAFLFWIGQHACHKTSCTFSSRVWSSSSSQLWCSCACEGTAVVHSR